ncbi:hypothetical protein K7X08_031458 [Anisodus acutangulus]|uniref:Uncharacterized protein n=1 Tax=Anisodus acutangulus TaxID=402998 RepID=A0A9Q1MPD9_9SOLA|nr:hypothetical protein K7X08_031458 [Anisodus acutangulus]
MERFFLHLIILKLTLEAHDVVIAQPQDDVADGDIGNDVGEAEINKRAEKADGHWGDCSNYFAPPLPSCSNENTSCAFEFDRNNDMENEEQSAGFEGIQAMIQTYMERESRSEEE